jgi:formylglycine-generating enzyme required for sulfatase activity
MINERKYGLIIIALLLLSQISIAQDSILINSIGMKFVLIRGGSMIVGRFQPTVSQSGFFGRGLAPELSEAKFKLGQEMAARDAMPGFSVNINYDYYIGKYEVTQEQWKKVMGNNPSYFQGNKVNDDAGQHPVESVNWKDAQEFISRLNVLEKGKHVYRLPSEFEWNMRQEGRRAGRYFLVRYWIDVRDCDNENKPGRHKKTECLGSLRYAGQCLGMGRRFLQRKDLR